MADHERRGLLGPLDLQALTIIAAAEHDQKAGATWADIEVKARDNPVLVRLVRHAEIYGREAALVQAVVFLADERQQRIQAEVERLQLAPAPPLLLCLDCPHRGKF